MVRYSPKIVTDGMVLCLDAGNPKSYPGSGTVWTDLSGYGYNGTLTGSSLPTFNSNNGGGFVFNGTSNYINITRPSSIITSGSISICMFAKWTTKTWAGSYPNNLQILIDNNHGAPPLRGFVIQDRPDLPNKPIGFGVYPSVNGATSSFQVGDGKWHFICGTYDGTTEKLYIDGRLDGWDLVPNMALVQPFITLGYGITQVRYLTGSISQVSIYNRALTATEVLQNYNAMKGRYGI